MEFLSKRQNSTLGMKEKITFKSQLSKLKNDIRVVKRISHFTDLDEDGVVDFYDKDIDGDGIHNLIDSHPFDTEIGHLDSDGDMIPDFVDFDKSFEGLSSLQELFFKQKKILIIAEENWKQEDIETVFKNISLNDFLIDKLKSLQIINLSQKEKLRYGDYNKQWFAINLYPWKLQGHHKLIYTTLTHEFFHVLSQDHPLLYEKFLKVSPWSIDKDKYGNNQYIFKLKKGDKLIFNDESLQYDFEENIALVKDDISPSFYSMKGPEEHFSECGLATIMFLAENKKNYDEDRFHRLDEFYKSELFFFLEEFLKN